MDKNLITAADFIIAIDIKYSAEDINNNPLLSQVYNRLNSMDIHQVITNDALVIALEKFLGD